ncbi:CDP-alcohol phosphatidyltransferase family protein [Falsirhodobacter halotolerans]|uniref:CDP-alcohol phosphatidyltransferase family protein n=1 Tax=Falsirhodobacter halotolerans TaxID=1146892 RepID=UPI001FD1BAE0|nr:CDP-alcohol phosphatidyltransferase family protein [Falsirhodobacter halotolerans]MCJ8138849.1 CDP-alcohol phosphatidyltransferase family protein [Falsirhodobacter halotolerans]
MEPRLKALSVHLLTATGVVLSMLALLAAVEGAWTVMFLWLVAALIVDGIDGPLARRYDVGRNWPTYDGVQMDLIIDYLTYVFIPAYALFASGLLDGWEGWLTIFVIVYGSVIYFVDTRMKTKDYSFAGFPGCWNMVVLVLFAVRPSETVILIITLLLTIAMFTNLKFIHPVRTKRWRPLSLPMTIAWTVFAGWAAWVDFDPQSWAHWGLIVTSVYLLLAGIAQQIIPERK